MNRKDKSAILLIACVILLLSVAGFGVYEKYKQSQLIGTYQKKIEKSTDNMLAEIKKAEEYNQVITTFTKGLGSYDTVNTVNDYQNIFSDNHGMIGVLNYDRLGVRLPIYHGVEDDVLEKGVGHVDDTAFPLDTVGAKSLLTGHTGAPGLDTLFTRLDESEVGDTFNIQLGTYRYTYKVVKTTVLTPEGAEDYARIPNNPEDPQEVTLITCTPWGINSHRLLSVGKFVKKEKINPKKVDTSIPISFGKETLFVIGATTLCIGLIARYVVMRKKEGSL